MTKSIKTGGIVRLLVFGSFQLVMVSVVVGGAIGASIYMKNNQPARVQVETQTFVSSVQTIVVDLRDRQIILSATGTIEPSVYVNLTPQVSGVVSSVKQGLGSGTHFAAQETLFSIDQRDLEIEVRRREADLGSARASLDIEQAQSENAVREWESFGRGAITDLAARGPQVRSAKAQVLAAEAGLETARLDLVRAGFSLPFDGRIVEVSVAPGQKVTASQNYGRAYAFDAIEVRVSFPPDDLAVLPDVEGTAATISAEVLGRTVELPGVVSRLDGEISRTTRMATLIVRLERQDVIDHNLLPGTFATISLQGPVIANVAEVPNAALQARDQVWTVIDGELHLTEDVTVIQRGRDTSLVTGLLPGARVAVGTIAGATNGMPVKAEAVPNGNKDRLAESAKP